MDILAHALWTGAGLALAGRYRPIAPPVAIATAVVAVLPDVVQMLPILGWWLLGSGTFAELKTYAMALPGQGPVLPPLVDFLSHHLHCITHSAIIAGAITLMLWVGTRTVWILLLGWWLHIVIDVFAHSAEYYPVPVLYPFTREGFDGVAWNEPAFIVSNYVALGAVYWWLVRPRHQGSIEVSRSRIRSHSK